MVKIWDLITHPSELRAVIQWSLFRAPLHERDPTKETQSMKRCYEFLQKTSRSFAMVIQELQPELRDPVIMFYLILRGLDTVEDDMTLPIERKEKVLREFYTYLDLPGWSFTENGKDEADRQLLVEFDVVIKEFGAIDEKYRNVIKDITNRMGNGMADYANNAAHNSYGVDSNEDFDLYCYYVAGLVGEGLTRLFIESGKENPKLSEAQDLAYPMGLFLQKTNIIRDYREDLDDDRKFWPKQVWSKYAKDLSDFTDPQNLDAALNCISEMTLITLVHAVDCLTYLSILRDQSVFNFCAIPQVMAIATLALVYRNPLVFERNIKIRRGESCKLMMESTNLRGVCDIFLRYSREIHRKATPTDPNFLAISVACGKIEQFVETAFPASARARLRQMELEAERADGGGALTPEQRKEMYEAYAAVVAVWIVLTLIVTFIAWLSGARFDWIFRDVVKAFAAILGGEVEGTPAHVEL